MYKFKSGYSLFFPNFIMINTIITTTITTINIPKPIPALNIPVIASQELISNERRNTAHIVKGFIFFIVYMFYMKTKSLELLLCKVQFIN